ncbi:MAG: MFS transporter [Candidatus Dormibacteria bacterium]
MTVSADDDRGQHTLGSGAGARDLWSAVAAVTAITLPTFLVGTLAVQLRQSLHFDPAQLGVVVGCSYAASTVFAIPSGRLVEELSGLRMLRYATLVCGLVMLLIAVVVQSWPELAVALVLAGAASSLGQTASNLFLSRRIDSRRQGLAFGIKQAAVPLAFLLGGLSVPVIALTVGWRWAFVGAAAVAAAAVLVLPHPRLSVAAQRRAAAQRPLHEPTLPLVALAVGFGLTLTACSSLGAFLVSSAVADGLGPAEAGLVAALASTCGIAVRVLVGYLADRRGGRHLVFVVAMMLVGAGGFALLAMGAELRTAVLFIPGAVVAFGIGWGWNGLFNFAVVRTHPRSPARATGITQTGGRLGSVVGPLVFGILVDHVGYPGAWAVACGEMLLGASTMVAARALLARRIRAERA